MWTNIKIYFIKYMACHKNTERKRRPEIYSNELRYSESFLTDSTGEVHFF